MRIASFNRYGFICDNKNNEIYGKKCSDYKVRFCCQHERESQWGRWVQCSVCFSIRLSLHKFTLNVFRPSFRALKVGAVDGVQQELRRRQEEEEPAVHPEEGRQEGLFQRRPARRRPVQGDGRGLQRHPVPTLMDNDAFAAIQYMLEDASLFCRGPSVAALEFVEPL